MLINSLSSEATAIAVRIDSTRRKIQVIDNGQGIDKSALSHVGEFNAEKIPNNFGKGEKNVARSGKSLINIRHLSSILIIMSRTRNSSDTYGKFFSEGKISVIRKLENRPASGTTITFYDSKSFCEWNWNIDPFTIRFMIVYLALLNPRVSFSVRDDANQSIILRIGKNQKNRHLLRVICDRQLSRGQVHRVKTLIIKRVKIDVFWGVECTGSKKIQQILLNLRPVNCPSLEIYVTKIVKQIKCIENTQFSLKEIFFIFYIQSPETEYKYSMNNGQLIVEFHDIQRIIRSIRKFFILSSSRKTNKLLNSSNYKPIVPPLFFHHDHRIFRQSWKKSFSTKEQSSEIETNDKKSQNEGIELKSIIFRNQGCSEITKKSEDAPSSKNESSKIIPKEQENYCSIFDVSQTSRRCLEKSEAGKFRANSQSEDQKDNQLDENVIEECYSEMKETFAIDEFSQWSNWTYRSGTMNDNKKTCDTNYPIIYQRFKFLPVHLHALLPRGNVKLISRDPLEDDKAPLNRNFVNRRQDLHVRLCTTHSLEFKLEVQSLKSMKVLNQVNHEFIVALTKQDDKKLLVIIDQHAMHERIRYENLLRDYKSDSKNHRFMSVVLHRPIVMSDFSPRACNLLSANNELLMRYGLKFSLRNENTLLIFGVPRCFLKKTLYTDNTILEIAVRKLLQEVLEDLISDGFKKLLPFTIHEAIASEACRGSIKFGDPLTPDQCDVLVSCWKDTDAPNRCAHGRPSVVPLLELSSYNEKNINSMKKLNFRSLLKSNGYVKSTESTEWTGLHQL